MFVLAYRSNAQPPKHPVIPHPPRRVLVIGDVLSVRGDQPSRAIVELAAALGPVIDF